MAASQGRRASRNRQADRHRLKASGPGHRVPRLFHRSSRDRRHERLIWPEHRFSSRCLAPKNCSALSTALRSVGAELSADGGGVSHKYGCQRIHYRTACPWQLRRPAGRIFGCGPCPRRRRFGRGVAGRSLRRDASVRPSTAIHSVISYFPVASCGVGMARHCLQRWRGRRPSPWAKRVIGRRLMAAGIAFVFVITARILEAASFQYAVGDCLVAAGVATLLTTVAPPQ